MEGPPSTFRPHVFLPLAAFLFLAILIRASFVYPPEPAPASASLPPPPPPRVLTPAPEIIAEAYFVKILGEEQQILKQREEKSLSPASITKLLTVVIASERLPPGAILVLTEAAKALEEKLVPAPAGEAFLRDDMIRLALIGSFNDAAAALLEAVEPDPTRARELLNQTAARIGMAHSHFENSTGLDAEGHETTAEDLARLAEYIARHHPDLLEMTRIREATVSSLSGQEYAITNTNELLSEFPALLGGKTGLTDKAKGTLLLWYPAGEKTAIIVILGSEDRFGDGRKLIGWIEENF